MVLIDYFRRQRENYRRRLAAERRNIDNYQQKVDELDQLYEEMRTKKQEFQDQERAYRDIARHNYADWSGDVYKNRFREKMQGSLIEDAVKPTIRAIDDNLDELNNQKTQYQNRINNTRGVIGYLESGINSLTTQIENLFN